jgi:tetratricopeptide (TPR) repeat protein
MSQKPQSAFLLLSLLLFAGAPCAGAQTATATAATAIAATAIAATAIARAQAIVLPFACGPEVLPNEADALAEILSSRLLDEGAFDLFEAERLARIAAEGGLELRSSDASKALAIARAAKADFVIASRAAKVKAKGELLFVVSSRLLAADSGKELFGKQAQFSERDMIQGMTDLARKIAVAARQRSDISLAQIDAFIRGGDYDNAEKFAGLYALAHPEDAVGLSQRSLLIDKALAARRFADAQAAARLFHYEEARRDAAEARRRDPPNDLYASYALSLEAEYASFVSTGVETRLDRAESLVDERKYDLASALLEMLSREGKLSARGEGLRERCGRGLSSARLRAEASGLLDAERYPEALAAIDQALEAVPGDPESLRLRSRIVESERRDSETRARVGGYLSELKGFDYRGLFVAHRRLGPSFRVGLGSLSLRSFDSSGGSWIELERGPFPSLDVSYERPFAQAFPSPFSFVDFDLSWALGGRLSGGVFRTSEGYPVTSLISDEVISGGLSAGLAARLTFLSFFFSGRAALEGGPLLIERRSRLPFAEDGSSLNELLWSAGYSLGLDLGWVPAERRALILGLEWGRPILASESALCESPESLSLSLSYGFGTR